MKIHRVKTRLVNSYVLEYPERICIVDVAINCERQVLGFVEEQLQRPVADIDLVCCTHDDPDHIGGVHALARLSGAHIAIPHAARVGWKKWLNDPAGPAMRFGTSIREAFRSRSWQMYANPQRDRVAKAQARYEGESIVDEVREIRIKHRAPLPGFEDWQVLHTPGHTWDSCCYYHAGTGSLLSGDTLLGSRKLGRLVVPSIYSNRKQTRATLQQLRALKLSAVYPGHGSPQFGDDLIEVVRLH